MKPNREELLFELALMKPAAERAPSLDGECVDDKALRARLDALLAAHEQPGGLFAESVPDAAGTMKIEFTDAPDETVGQKIGRYKNFDQNDPSQESTRPWTVALKATGSEH